jgi:hypothetical protein
MRRFWPLMVIAPFVTEIDPEGVYGRPSRPKARCLARRRNGFATVVLSPDKMERNMATQKLVLLTVAIIALATPALAQGAGGGGGGGAGGGGAGAAASGAASGGGAASSGAGAGTGGTAGVANSGTGGIADNGNRTTTQTPATNTDKIVAGEKAAAVQGTKTVATPGDGSAVSAPGVGVGHAANGLPIGTPGSGLGSPENSVGTTK